MSPLFSEEEQSYLFRRLIREKRGNNSQNHLMCNLKLWVICHLVDGCMQSCKYATVWRHRVTGNHAGKISLFIF